MRYARIISDAMGETGVISHTGAYGFAGKDNYSVLGGMSLEAVKEILANGSAMGNIDNLNGVAESVLVGKTVKVGDYAPT